MKPYGIYDSNGTAIVIFAPYLELPENLDAEEHSEVTRRLNLALEEAIGHVEGQRASALREASEPLSHEPEPIDAAETDADIDRAMLDLGAALARLKSAA